MPRLFVDNLTVIDCSVLDPKRGLIGASWSVNLELAGDLDHQSMVFDFAKVKKAVKQWIDREVDHKLLVPTQYKHAKVEQSEASSAIRFKTKNGQELKHSSPNSALCLIDAKRISRKCVRHFIAEQLAAALPSNVTEIKVTLHNESRIGRYYTYSHGLKKHDGNCQRIAHGHRSKIEIWKNKIRSRKLEKDLAEKWSDIYLGSSEDVSEFSANSVSFKYSTEQGDFSLTLPEERVYLMESDTTVECIAEHVLAVLEEDMPKAKFKVRAYEGISKGAIAESG